MKRINRYIFVGAIAAAVISSAAPAIAQTGGGYDLTWNTWDNSGGATFMTGGAYSLGATVGQADAGTSSGGAYTLNGGFWYDAFIRVFVPSTRRDSSNAW